MNRRKTELESLEKGDPEEEEEEEEKMIRKRGKTKYGERPKENRMGKPCSEPSGKTVLGASSGKDTTKGNRRQGKDHFFNGSSP